MAMTSIDTRYSDAVHDIRRLLTRMHSAAVDVFVRLRDVERANVWALGGHKSFQAFLHAEFPNALGLEKYTNAIKAIELYGEDLVRKVGVDAAHAMCPPSVVNDDAKRQLVVDHIERHIADVGCAPRADTIRGWVNRIAPETVKPTRIARVIQADAALKRENAELRQRVNAAQKVEQRAAKVETLEQECIRLRAEVKAQAKQILKLEAENARLQKALGRRATN